MKFEKLLELLNLCRATSSNRRYQERTEACVLADLLHADFLRHNQLGVEAIRTPEEWLILRKGAPGVWYSAAPLGPYRCLSDKKWQHLPLFGAYTYSASDLLWVVPEERVRFLEDIPNRRFHLDPQTLLPLPPEEDK